MLRTISELWVERFYGELRRLAEAHQLQWMLEPYFLLNHDWRTAAARANLAGCEFFPAFAQEPIITPHVTFDALADWTQRAEPGIRYYSGAATYQEEFDLPPGHQAGGDQLRRKTGRQHAGHYRREHLGQPADRR
jgi:hypothetical protein